MADRAGHLDADAIAAWVDGRLEPSARVEVESHLAECAACRGEIVAVSELVGSWQGSGGRLQFLKPLALAATVLLAVGLPLALRAGRHGEEPRVRRPAAEARAELQAVLPVPDADVRAGTPIRFTWRALDPGSSFRLTLVDESGATIWSTETGDTSATLPETVTLQAGRTWFWYVDAIRSDGRSVSTGAHRFTTR